MFTATRGDRPVYAILDRGALLRLLCLGRNGTPTPLGEACLEALSMMERKLELDADIRDIERPLHSSFDFGVCVAAAGMLVLEGYQPFGPILESVESIARSSGASPFVLLLKEFLRKADTSIDTIVQRVNERKEAYEKALSNPGATDETVAAALEPDVVPLEALKVSGSSWEETSAKQRDGVYMLLSNVEDGTGVAAKVGLGPRNRAEEQLNPKGEEPLMPEWLALFPQLLAGLRNEGTDDATRCNLATFVKDLFEFLLTALLIGFLRGRQNFGSVSSYNGAGRGGALPPRARTDANAPAGASTTHALKHALMHSHAAPICAGYSALAAQRDGLEKQLQQPGLSAAEQASLKKALDDVQTKIAAGGKALTTERAELGKRLASDELSEPERAETQQKLDVVQTKMAAGGKALPAQRAELMASPDLHAVGSRQLAGFSRRIANQMAAPPCDCATQAMPPGRHRFHSATRKGNGRRRLIEPARTANCDPPIQKGRIHKGRTPWNGAGHAM
jgi:hypothetical protein